MGRGTRAEGAAGSVVPGVLPCLALLLCASAVLAGEHPHVDASAHAPIGVMGDHTHAAGEVMFSYRYMRMGMNGMRDQDERISRSRVLGDFAVTPTKMDMEMHMFGLMVAPVDRLTLMLMVPYVLLEMEHRTRMNTRFTTRAEGLGDVRATALIELFEKPGHAVHANLGLSFPTGSLSEVDRTPLSNPAKVRLPYPMQLGSGTWDFLPGITYRGKQALWSWGGQARGEVRMNENHAQYRRGHEYAMTAWGAYSLADWLSASLRFEWQHELNVQGRDANIATRNPMGVPLVPTADPGRQARMRLDALVGLNIEVPVEPLHGLRFAIEAGLPAYQRLDGPALETDWLMTFGVQMAFP